MADSPMDLWSALLGQGRDVPIPADIDLWRRISDQLNPAKARPVLRAGVERSDLMTARGVPYVMLRSPDDEAAYVRLTHEEADLAFGMDGSRTVAQMVGDFARTTGQLAPDQVRRVVADLGGGRMLQELPLDAFSSLSELHRPPWPVRVGRAIGRAASGQRYVLFNPDRAAGAAYRFGGRLLFTRAGVAVLALIGMLGFGLWLRTWFDGSQSALVANDSYGAGLLLLLGFNVLGLLCHESGHALAAKHAGRRVPSAGVLMYFGIPTAFVDTTDAWMASRRSRLIVTACGPGFTLAFAGAIQVIALYVPTLRPVAFPLGLAWYINSLFNLNPLMTLDGYYLLTDYLEVPNLRPRAMVRLAGWIRHPATVVQQRSNEEKIVALYAVISTLWLVIFLAVVVRLQMDRFTGLWAGLWHRGWVNRAILVFFVMVILSPVVYSLVNWVARRIGSIPDRMRARRRDADRPRRLAAVSGTEIGGLDAGILESFAEHSSWLKPRRGTAVQSAGSAMSGLIVVIDGALEGRRRGDPADVIRARAEAGQLVGLHHVRADTPSALTWTTVGTTLLVVPPAVVVGALGSAGGGNVHEVAELAASPALAGLPEDEREAIAAKAKLTDAAPNQQFSLSGPYAAVVWSGSVETEGRVAGPGSVLGPPGDTPIPVVARTKTRLWSFPITGVVAASLGTAGAAAAATTWQAPASGVHSADGPPPPPWGPPPTGGGGDDDGADGEFDRKLIRSLLALVLLLVGVAVFSWGATVAVPSVAWAETPTSSVTFEASGGPAVVVVDGDEKHLSDGERIVLGNGDSIVIADGAVGLLRYRGGAIVHLCSGSDVEVDDVGQDGSRRLSPHGSLTVHNGVVVADTDSRSSAFEDLALSILTVDHTVANDGEALYYVGGGGAAAREGRVLFDDTEITPDPEAAENCGPDGALPAPPSPLGPTPPLDPEPPVAPPAPPPPATIPTEPVVELLDEDTARGTPLPPDPLPDTARGEPQPPPAPSEPAETTDPVEPEPCTPSAPSVRSSGISSDQMFGATWTYEGCEPDGFQVLVEPDGVQFFLPSQGAVGSLFDLTTGPSARSVTSAWAHGCPESTSNTLLLTVTAFITGGDSASATLDGVDCAITVPNVSDIGLTVEVAEQALIEDGFALGEVTTIPEEGAFLGEVVDQTPPGESPVDYRMNVVDLVVYECSFEGNPFGGTPSGTIVDSQSGGPVAGLNVLITDASGNTEAPLSTAVTDDTGFYQAGCLDTDEIGIFVHGNAVGYESGYGNPILGTVVASFGEASTTAPAEVVELAIDPLVTVPPVVGMPELQALDTLVAAGLVGISQDTTSGTIVQVGDVVSQQPEGGSQAAVGSSVSIEVCRGRSPIDITWAPTTASSNSGTTTWSYDIGCAVPTGFYIALHQRGAVPTFVGWYDVGNVPSATTFTIDDFALGTNDCEIYFVNVYADFDGNSGNFAGGVADQSADATICGPFLG